MKTIFYLLVFLLIISCNNSASDQHTVETEKNDVATLNQLFVAGWNNHDSAAIMGLFTNNSIVFNDSVIHKGTAEIADRWVSGGVKVLGNIVTVPIVQNSNQEIAFEAGTYSLDITLPDIILKEKGNYTMIWEKKEEAWKISVVHIEDITQMPDIK